MSNLPKANRKNKEIVFKLKEKIYSKDVIFKTCYVFIDKFYIYLDKKGIDIRVKLRAKENLGNNDLRKAEGEFKNELLNGLVRKEVFRQNKKLIESIVGGAIAASLENKEKAADSKVDDTENEISLLKKELESLKIEGDYEKDPLGIKKISGKNGKRKKK